jgi:hypothetical protein
MENYNKGNEQEIFESLLGEKFSLARTLAPQILASAIVDGNLNPSTRLHILLESFEELSKPQLLE